MVSENNDFTLFKNEIFCLDFWDVILFIGERLTLSNSVLVILAIYYMSIFKVLDRELKKLETRRTCFFWGSEISIWVNWNKLIASKKSSLGVGSLSTFNQAFFLKCC